MRYVPVAVDAQSPTRVDGAGEDLVTLGGPPSPFAPDGMTMTAGTVTTSLLANLGLGNLVITGSAQYYLLDYVVTQHVAATDPQDAALYTVYGVGLRLGFRGEKVSGKASFSIGALAASASIKGSATSFQAQTVGIGLTAASLAFVQSLVRLGAASFNVDTLTDIGSAFSQLADYLGNPANMSTVTPKVVGVVLDYEQQTESTAASYGYALRSLEAGSTLAGAKAGRPKSLPNGPQRLDTVVSGLYASVLGTTDPSRSPLQVGENYARQLDKCGP